MSKKLLIGLAIAGAVVYANKDSIFGTKGTETPGTGGGATDNHTQRLLTDAEALSYLNANPDLIATYGAGNIEQARQHFNIIGYTENRTM